MSTKRKPVVPASPSASDAAAANARNKGVGRIGNTPLAIGGVLRNGKVEGLEPNAYNMRAPGKRFGRNVGTPDQKRIVENEKLYSASLAKRNALSKLKTMKAGK